MKYQVNFFVNEEPVELYVDANKTLLNVLREELDLTGAIENYQWALEGLLDIGSSSQS